VKVDGEGAGARTARIISVVIFALAVVLPIAVVYSKLASPGIPLTRTFFPKDYAEHLAPVPFSFYREGDNSKFSIEFDLSEVSQFLTAQNVGVRLGTYFTTPDILSAELTIGTCLFRAGAIPNFADNSSLLMTKVGNCDSDSLKGRAKLAVLATAATSQLVVWGAQVEAKNSLGGVLPGQKKLVPVYFLEMPTRYPVESKLSLLKKTWGAAEDLLITALIAAGILFILAGLILVYAVNRKETSQNFLIGFGFSLLFLSLAVVHSCLAPPFQAPDEPDHFLGICGLLGIPSASSDALELAALGHFGRIRQDTEQRFTVDDGQVPGSKSWEDRGGTDVFPTDMVSRAPLSALYWTTVSPWLFANNPPIATRLLGMRLISAFTGFLGFALFSIGLARRVKHTLGYVLALAPVLFLLPLPFFAMHVSNYAQMLAVTLALAGIALMPAASFMGSVIRMAILGGLSICFLDSGRTAILGFGLVTYLIAKSFSDDWIDRGHRHAKASEMVAELLAYSISFCAVAKILGFLPAFPENVLYPYVKDLNLPVGTYSFMVCAVILMAVGLGLASTVCLGVKRLGVVLDRMSWSKPFTKIANASFLVAVVLAFLAPAFLDSRPLWNIELPRIDVSVFRYVKRALHLAFFTPSPWIDDFFVVKSLWFGFGWLDIFPPPALLILVKLIVSLCALKYIWDALTEGEGSKASRWISLAVDAAVCALCLGIYAYASYRIRYNLHGRYLVSMYILSSALLGLIPYRSGALNRFRVRLTPLVAFSVVGALQSVALLTIVSRYFG
jgi:hypothetical protein